VLDLAVGLAEGRKGFALGIIRKSETEVAPLAPVIISLNEWHVTGSRGRTAGFFGVVRAKTEDTHEMTIAVAVRIPRRKKADAA
jgi:hypothetical protein